MKGKFILLLVVSLFAAGSYGDWRELPGDKFEWSILQGIEFDNRDKPLQVPTQISVQGYEILGIRNMTGSGYVWISYGQRATHFTGKFQVVISRYRSQC
jgi:hypothetical protein